MQRRHVVTLGGLVLAQGALRATAAADPATPQGTPPPPTVEQAGASADTSLYPDGWSSLLHVWTDAQRVSHAEHLIISTKVQPIPVTRLVIRPESKGFVDWHNVRSPAFAITIEGDLEVEVSDGTRLALPPSRVAYLEDVTGKGHITRTRAVVNMFIETPQGFDVRRWARGET